MLWDGRELGDEALMLHCEQGFGDNLQFIRLLPLLRERVKTVHLACHKELVRLFSGLKGLASIVTDGQPLPKCAYHVPLLSLARIFKITLETLPRRVPYLPVPAVMPRDRAARKRVGLAWRASRLSPNGAYRSVSLADLRPLANLPIEWVSLQKDPDAEEQQILREDFHAEEKGSAFRDFQDTADSVQSLDLGGLRRYIRRPRWRRARTPDGLVAPQIHRLALAAQPRRQPLVSDGHALSPGNRG